MNGSRLARERGPYQQLIECFILVHTEYDTELTKSAHWDSRETKLLSWRPLEQVQGLLIKI